MTSIVSSNSRHELPRVFPKTVILFALCLSIPASTFTPSHCFSALLCVLNSVTNGFGIVRNPLNTPWDIDPIVSCKSTTAVWRCWPGERREDRTLFMGRVFFIMRPPGNWTPREQRVNQVYSKIYVSYPPMSHSSATPIPSHQLVSSEQASAPVGEFEPDHRAKTQSRFYWRSWLVLGQFGRRGVTTLWSRWDLTWARVILTVKTCGGAGAHYVIMLSGRLFILTSWSQPRHQWEEEEEEAGRTDVQRIALDVFSNKAAVCSSIHPPRTRPHQLLIQPISKAALFTRKLWSHPLTPLPRLIVASPRRRSHSPQSPSTLHILDHRIQNIHEGLRAHSLFSF